jgi:hypothetical protein
LRESWRTVISAQADGASAIGFERCCRSRRRQSGSEPLIVFSTA